MSLLPCHRNEITLLLISQIHSLSTEAPDLFRFAIPKRDLSGRVACRIRNAFRI